MAREEFKPGTLIRRKGGQGGVAMVYGCTCHSYILWPKDATTGKFEEARRFYVPFGLAHLRWERDEAVAVPPPPPPPIPKPSEALAQFRADIGNTDAFVKLGPDETREQSGLWCYADSLLGILRAELDKRVADLKSRGA